MARSQTIGYPFFEVVGGDRHFPLSNPNHGQPLALNQAVDMPGVASPTWAAFLILVLITAPSRFWEDESGR